MDSYIIQAYVEPRGSGDEQTNAYLAPWTGRTMVG